MDTATIETMVAEDLTLDPQNWDLMRRVAHQALDKMLDYQSGIRQEPVWRQIPEQSEAFLSQPAPNVGLGPEQVVAEMLEHVTPYPAGHAHPRFWGWVCGTGTPIGMIADMMAAGVNASAGTFNDAASRLEDQVLGWMRDLFRFPEGTSGIITSGASVANLIGLSVARDAVLKKDVRRHGLSELSGMPVVYASAQGHSSVDKAMMLMGLGRDNLRKVPVDADFRMRVDALDEMIREDLARKRLPIAVAANAGTVNTGALDDLEAIGSLARRRGLWFHIDGAIGALSVMSPKLRERFPGMELADSLAFDFHKWLYVPYEAGCVLIRDGVEHRKSFYIAAGYLEAPERGIAANDDTSNVRGPQLSRGFKALKVWAQIREFGIEKLGQLHEQNVAQVEYLATLIDVEDRLERTSSVQLNIVTYRYVPEFLSQDQSDLVNREILMRIQEQGIAAPSSTRINGRFCLRIANTNHRSRREDFDLLVRESIRLGQEIEASWLESESKD